MKWNDIIEDDYSTYPKEGYDVIVTDGMHYDVAWYLMSSEYKWMKTDIVKDSADEFNQFKIAKWSYINKIH